MRRERRDEGRVASAEKQGRQPHLREQKNAPGQTETVARKGAEVGRGAPGLDDGRRDTVGVPRTLLESRRSTEAARQGARGTPGEEGRVRRGVVERRRAEEERSGDHSVDAEKNGVCGSDVRRFRNGRRDLTATESNGSFERANFCDDSLDGDVPVALSNHTNTKRGEGRNKR